MERLLEAIEGAGCVAAMTGAGVSTLCGIPDFRGPQGLYRQPDAERIFDIDWFDRDPSIYYRGCRDLVYGLGRFEPGPVHLALKRLEDRGKLAGIVTQNIDMLHQRAGSSNVYEVHGSPVLHRCRRCGDVKTYDEIRAIRAAVRSGQRGGLGGASRPGEPQRGGGLQSAADDPAVPRPQGGGGLQAAADDPAVPRCAKCGGVYKPDITFFGEALPEDAFRGAMALASRCDLMVVLGSSLVVQPAASIPLAALRSGARLAIVNRGETPLDPFAFFRADDLASFASAVLSAFPA